jgi:hypothetical protein
MDAYVYHAALWCGPCMIKRLVEEKKASPGALGMKPADALQQIVSSNGFTDESDYDSDDLPKGSVFQRRWRSRYTAALRWVWRLP